MIKKLYDSPFDEIGTHYHCADFKCDHIVVSDTKVDFLLFYLTLIDKSLLLNIILADLRCLSQNAKCLCNLLSFNWGSQLDIISVKPQSQNRVDLAIKEEVAVIVLHDEFLAYFF